MVIWSSAAQRQTDVEMSLFLAEHGLNPVFEPVKLVPKLRVHCGVNDGVTQRCDAGDGDRQNLQVLNDCCLKNKRVKGNVRENKSCNVIDLSSRGVKKNKTETTSYTSKHHEKWVSFC